MLFVHFTPKTNVKRIKRVGLRPGKDGVFLRPLLRGEKSLTNDWNAPGSWTKGSARHDREMAKIVVRIPDDQWIRMGDCGDSRLAEPITVRELGRLVASWDLKRNPGPRWIPCGIPLLDVRDERFEASSPTWPGLEVLYKGRIPARWIVNIFDHTNTDQRSKRYHRQAKTARHAHIVSAG